MLPEFSIELATQLVNSDRDFPVDFQLGWQWLGYSRKDNAKEFVVKNLEEGLDYLVSDNGNCHLSLDGLYFWSGYEDTPVSLSVHIMLFNARKHNPMYKKRLSLAYKAFGANFDKHQRFMKREDEKDNELLNLVKDRVTSCLKQPCFGFVYLVQTREFYKIGFSSVGGQSRVKALQTGNPLKISFVAEFKAFDFNEKEIHETFKKFRAHGEWFQKDSSILKFFKSKQVN